MDILHLRTSLRAVYLEEYNRQARLAMDLQSAKEKMNHCCKVHWEANETHQHAPEFLCLVCQAIHEVEQNLTSLAQSIEADQMEYSGRIIRMMWQLLWLD